MSGKDKEKKIERQDQPPTEQTDQEAPVELLKQQLQRLGADYQNYQKRSQKQVEQSTQFAKENFVRDVLPVLDNFRHTLEKGTEAQDAAAIIKGAQIVYDHLANVLAGQGVKQIEVAQGDAFDPSRHEAVVYEENEQLDENTVVRELAAGYLMNGRTIRPAKVTVAKSPDKKEQ